MSTFSPVQWCLSASVDVPAMETVDDWLANWRQLPLDELSPFALAVMGGCQADRAAWAFSAGYEAALRAMFPQIRGGGLHGFSLSEEGVRSPRDLQTLWRTDASGGIQLSGNKGWVPCRSIVKPILWFAVPAGQTALSVVRLPATADGVTMSPRNPAAFMPELPAARMQLQDVQLDASAMLPGDGWSDYARPFGALEELYVSAALMGYLLREGRAREWPQALLRQMLAAISLLERIAPEVGSANRGQLLLAGATEWVRALMTQATAEWAKQPNDEAGQRWVRDQTVQRMWAAAGAKRGERAWQALTAAQ
ncbi:hypothetical protein UMZ34_17610 [Halopseudomonas pachastrellae]|nr:hypothetical protein UMZ34_17610 [Halopseudomonas pachastrellae]